MKFNPEIHHRKSIRLRGFDYSQPGCYFVTVCTAQKRHLLGRIVDGVMHPNDAGRMVDAIWRELPARHPVSLDEYVIMPNHFHGIVRIEAIVGARFIAPNLSRQAVRPKGTMNGVPTIGKIVHDLKARCTHAINQSRSTPGVPVWQRNYWERVIRNEAELASTREYIRNNSKQWELDELNVL